MSDRRGRGDPQRFDLPLHGSHGVKRWARWHRRRGAAYAPAIICQNPMKYWHSHARRNVLVSAPR